VNYLQTYKIFESNNTNLGIFSDYTNSANKLANEAKQKKDDLDSKYKPMFIKYIKNCLHKFGDIKSLTKGSFSGGRLGKILSIAVYNNDQIRVKCKPAGGTHIRYKDVLIGDDTWYDSIDINDLHTEELSVIVKLIMESDFMEEYTMSFMRKINN